MPDDFGDQDSEVERRILDRWAPYYCGICKGHIKELGLLSEQVKFAFKSIPKSFRYCQKCQKEYTGALSICNDDGRGQLTLIEVSDDD